MILAVRDRVNFQVNCYFKSIRIVPRILQRELLPNLFVIRIRPEKIAEDISLTRQFVPAVDRAKIKYDWYNARALLEYARGPSVRGGSVRVDSKKYCAPTRDMAARNSARTHRKYLRNNDVVTARNNVYNYYVNCKRLVYFLYSRTNYRYRCCSDDL